MQTKLVRGEVSKAVDPLLFEEESRVDLAKQAKTLLGYEKLHDQIAFKNNTIKKIEKAVEAAKVAFANVGLEPLTDQSVQLYKAKKVHWETRKCFWRNFCNSERGIQAMTAFPVTAVLGAVVFGLSIMITDPNHLSAYRFFDRIGPVYFSFCALSFLMWPVIAASRYATKKTAYTFSWARRDLRHCNDEVPLFAVSHAVALKKELPTADFQVESFTRNGYQCRSVVFDPFLIMNLDGIEFYIDVWNEPKYEARKTV
jgi:hypothetical protein